MRITTDRRDSCARFACLLSFFPDSEFGGVHFQLKGRSGVSARERQRFASTLAFGLFLVLQSRQGKMRLSLSLSNRPFLLPPRLAHSAPWRKPIVSRWRRRRRRDARSSFPLKADFFSAATNFASSVRARSRPPAGPSRRGDNLDNFSQREREGEREGGREGGESNATLLLPKTYISLSRGQI